MNRRIRKKQDKKITEAINGLIFIAERREQQRQAAIRQFVKRCETLYEQQRKEELTQKQRNRYLTEYAPLQKFLSLTTEYRRAADT